MHIHAHDTPQFASLCVTSVRSTCQFLGVFVSAHMHALILVGMSACGHACMHVHACLCLHVRTCVRVAVAVAVCTCARVCMCVCMHMHACTHTSDERGMTRHCDGVINV